MNLKQPAYKISYYALEYDAPEFTGKTPLPVAIKMERIGVSPLYNSINIVYRENEYSRDAYSYHKWRINPGDMVTDLLTRDMRESGLFRAVINSGSSGSGAYYNLGGNVEGFYEEDEGKDRFGALSITINLVNEKEQAPDRKIMFQKTYIRKKRCEKNNPRALAKALSEGMREISAEIINDVYNALKTVE